MDERKIRNVLERVAQRRSETSSVSREALLEAVARRAAQRAQRSSGTATAKTEAISRIRARVHRSGRDDS